VCGVTTVIFSLLTLFTGVGAWFMTVTVVEQQSNSFSVTKTQLIAFEGDTYDIYCCDLATDNPIMIEDGDLALGNYNIYLPNRNSFCRRIIHFKLLFPSGVERASTVTLSSFCTADYSASNSIIPSISNMIEFKYFVNSNDNLIANKTVKEAYSTLHDAFDNISTKYLFAERTVVAGENEGDPSTISVNKTKTLVLNIADMVANPSPTQKMDLYFQYDYNEELIGDYINEKKGGDPHFFDNTDITFTPDITEIKFDLVPKGGN